MMHFILGILSSLFVLFIFTALKSKIVNIAKNRILHKDEEPFQLKKFLKGFAILDLKLWAKSLTILYRHLIIFALIFGAIYGYGWYRGRLGKSVTFNMEGKNAYIKLNDHYLHIKPNGTADVVDKDKKTVLKEIKVSDIPSLRKALKPYGFIFKPIGVLGYGVGNNKRKFEVGAGVSFLKYFKWRLDSFLTNMGIYLGTSYKITNNSGLGLGIGKGYQGDNRILFYYKWNF